MSYRSKTISKLLVDGDSRYSYVRAKLNQLIPSQIRALRLRRPWTQMELGDKAGMKQARISAIETPGEVNFSLETLVRIASAFGVGLKVEFVPYSEMLRWETGFSQDEFSVVPIERDVAFTEPQPPVMLYSIRMDDQYKVFKTESRIDTPEIENPNRVKYPDTPQLEACR